MDIEVSRLTGWAVELVGPHGYSHGWIKTGSVTDAAGKHLGHVESNGSGHMFRSHDATGKAIGYHGSQAEAEKTVRHGLPRIGGAKPGGSNDPLRHVGPKDGFDKGHRVTWQGASFGPGKGGKGISVGKTTTHQGTITAIHAGSGASVRDDSTGVSHIVPRSSLKHR